MRSWTTSLFLYLYLLVLAVPDIRGFFGLTAREPLLALSTNMEERKHAYNQGNVTSADLCNLLVLQKRQKRQCRKNKGVAETLVTAVQSSVLQCQLQFKHERWNCSLGEYRKYILKRGFKETSFLFAISSAGLVHEVARACARGVIDRCTCDESEHLENAETWRWGGCGDNIQYGLKFTRKFLQEAKRSEKDIRAKIDVHNSDVGIKVVKDLANTTCKCHGVSGSCTVRTCWLRLSPFITVGDVLKNKYEKSAKVISFQNHATGKSQLMKRRKKYDESSDRSTAPLRKSELAYIEDSPNFCLNSSYSPGTSGRLCIKGDNCDSICCGRGYNVQKQKIKKSCNCETIWCCTLTCNVCLSEEEVYLCK